MIEESLSSLSKLDTFDKNAFIGDNGYSQDLCNFILALSLIWNDTKNIIMFHDYIISLKPKDKEHYDPKDMPVKPILGEISGIEVYLEKSLIAVIHELFILVRNSKDVVESDCFKKICKKLHKNCRESWGIIISYAFGGADSKTPLGKALLMVRHKIANHYDEKEIFKGYKKKFLMESNILYISRGIRMCEKRFYFADAAAQEYYKSQQEKVTPEEFYKNITLIRDCINLAIQNLVDTFIQSRSSWRQVRNG
ncbi:hypothetical protein ACFL1R_09250 [Candidatus Latescibacterota bacterium]